MNDKPNGHDMTQPADSPGPVSQDVAALAAQLGHITGPIKNVVSAMVRGMLVQHAGVPPHVILNAIAWQCGNILATVPQGPMPMLMQLRHGMRDAFADGQKKAPMVDPQAQRAAAVLERPRG